MSDSQEKTSECREWVVLRKGMMRSCTESGLLEPDRASVPGFCSGPDMVAMLNPSKEYAHECFLQAPDSLV